MGYQPVAELLWNKHRWEELHLLNCESLRREISEYIQANCLNSRSFSEYTPSLAYKCIEHITDEKKKKKKLKRWLNRLEEAWRDYACSDCTMGLSLAFGYLGGRNARRRYLKILRDESAGNSTVSPG